MRAVAHLPGSCSGRSCRMTRRLGSYQILRKRRQAMTARTKLRDLYDRAIAVTKRKFFVYLQCYFVTIATILGTGVLGLPVTLSHSGLWPFVVSFVAGFLVQGLLIVFMADLLQKAVHIRSSMPSQPAPSANPEKKPYATLEQDAFATVSFPGSANGGNSSSEEKSGYSDLDQDTPNIVADDNIDVKETTDALPYGRIVPAAEQRGQSRKAASSAAARVVHPDLHLLAELFLPRGLRELFDLLLIFQFLALLISYCLAGSEAFAALLKVNLLYTIPVFCWLLSLLVVFAMKFVQPFVSFLTFCKGSMLLVTVALTFGVGATVNREIHNDFGHIGSSFLMGTVALGGVANVMPYLYEKIASSASQVRRFRWACFLGLATCTVLNIAWCWAVLDIVPQTDTDAATGCTVARPTAAGNSSFLTATAVTVTAALPAWCSRNGSISLESARRNGEISTIPLTQILDRDYPSYSWVALLIQLFIVISITVSFLINGSVLYHTVKGLLHAKWPIGRFRCCDRGKHVTTEGITSAAVQLFFFGIVFAVSMTNPKSFVKMLEKVASFSMNFEVALFLTVMFWKSCTKENASLPVPVVLPGWLRHTRHVLTLYFSVAVVYDIVISVMEATGSDPE